MRVLPADPDDWTVGGIRLEQLDEEGTEWFGAGPPGERVGDLDGVLAGCAGTDVDPEWMRIVADAIQASSAREERSGLIACRAAGVWYHVTSDENRASIRAHGLDWTRFSGSGIAGSRAPEAAGVFLCREAEGADFFIRMGRQRGHGMDVWAVALDGQWLISDPGAGGGLDDTWMICLSPIPAQALTLAPPNKLTSVHRDPTG